VATIGISSFLLAFSFGMSSTPWTLNAEIYPLHVIGTASSLSSTTNWITNALVAESFKLITEISVTAKVLVYLSLAGFCIGCFIFTYKWIPETSGKSIDRILEEILGPKPTADVN